MEKQLALRSFLNKRVMVRTYDGVKLQGDLIAVDKSGHGSLGNIILQWNGGLTIIRGDAIQSISSNSANDQTFHDRSVNRDIQPPKVSLAEEDNGD